MDPKSEPTICADICSWEPLPLFAPGHFDMIWASPVCAEYSRAMTRHPRKLEEGDCLAIRALEIIRDLRPRFWALENPQTGLLKTRPFMANLDWSDVTYCKYGYPYKKPTRIWHDCGSRQRSRRGAAFALPVGLACARKARRSRWSMSVRS